MRPLNPPKGRTSSLFMPTFRLGRNECVQQYKSSNKGAPPKGDFVPFYAYFSLGQKRMRAAIQIKQQRSAPEGGTSSLFLCLLSAWAEMNACSNTNQATKKHTRRGGLRPFSSYCSLGQKRMHAAIQIKQQRSAPEGVKGATGKPPCCSLILLQLPSSLAGTSHSPFPALRRQGRTRR